MPTDHIVKPLCTLLAYISGKVRFELRRSQAVHQQSADGLIIAMRATTYQDPGCFGGGLVRRLRRRFFPPEVFDRWVGVRGFPERAGDPSGARVCHRDVEQQLRAYSRFKSSGVDRDRTCRHVRHHLDGLEPNGEGVSDLQGYLEKQRLAPYRGKSQKAKTCYTGRRIMAGA